MFLKLIQSVNACLTDYALMVLLIGIGLWYSIQTRFIQVRCFREGLRHVRDGLSSHGTRPERGMTSLQALSTAFAGQIGAGNLVGAAGAILTGGPGAIFWMWVTAFLGMATAYAETVLAVQTRPKARERHYQGGPVRYIAAAFEGERGEKAAAFFAAAAVLALGFFGPMVQSNAVAAAFHYAFGVPSLLTGLALGGIFGAAFLGGFRRIVSTLEKWLPFAAGGFLVVGAVVLLVRIAYLPAALWMIFRYAFTPAAIIGGGFGSALKIAVSQGVKRGLFSNEAGLGSAPHAHAQANVASPHEQGVVAMTAVFADTFLVLTLNALVILSTLYAGGGPLSQGYTGAAVLTLSPANLTQSAFGSVFGGGVGGVFVAGCLLIFSLSTILNWNLFGRLNMVYLFGRDSNTVYTLTSMCFLLLGALASTELVWELSDFFNLLMTLPNVAALFILTGPVVDALRQSGQGTPSRERK